MVDFPLSRWFSGGVLFANMFCHVLPTAEQLLLGIGLDEYPVIRATCSMFVNFCLLKPTRESCKKKETATTLSLTVETPYDLFQKLLSSTYVICKKK